MRPRCGFEFVAVCPARFFVGGVGSNRPAGMCPMPISRALWRAASVPKVNDHGVSADMVDACCSGLENLPRRAKPPSASGNIFAYCTRSSAPVHTDVQIPLAKMRARLDRVVSVKSGIRTYVDLISLARGPLLPSSFSVFLDCVKTLGRVQFLKAAPRLSFVIVSLGC